MNTLAHRKSVAIVLGLAGVVLLVVAAVSVYSVIELVRFERAEVRRATFVYAAGQTLTPGVHIGRVDLAGTLARLGYVETREAPRTPGQYRRTPAAWDIVLREGGARIRLDIRDERIARAVRDGKQTEDAALEGLVLSGGGDQGGEDYRPVKLADVPKVVVDAVLAAEDHRFFEHGAVDVRGLARAGWTNLVAGRVRQGGSTLTQQLVKNRLLTPERTVGRKLREAWLAALVEWRYSKPQILEAYLNEIYLGQDGDRAIHGVGAAARYYFGK
jgi:penicillin-binding protein 1B